VILVAGWTAFEVRAHARNLLVGVCRGEFQFDVAVELLEALLAGQLWSRWAEEQCQAALVVGCVVCCHDAGMCVPPTPSSGAASAARSLRPDARDGLMERLSGRVDPVSQDVVGGAPGADIFVAKTLLEPARSARLFGVGGEVSKSAVLCSVGVRTRVGAAKSAGDRWGLKPVSCRRMLRQNTTGSSSGVEASCGLRGRMVPLRRPRKFSYTPPGVAVHAFADRWAVAGRMTIAPRAE
jgi:hypothetical protein